MFSTLFNKTPAAPTTPATKAASATPSDNELETATKAAEKKVEEYKSAPPAATGLILNIDQRANTTTETDKPKLTALNSAADFMNEHKSAILKVALTAAAASAGSGVGLPIAGAILVGIFVVSQALNQNIKSRILRVFLNNVLVMLIQLEITYSLITELQTKVAAADIKVQDKPVAAAADQTVQDKVQTKQFTIKLNETVAKETNTLLNNALTYIIAILPDESLSEEARKKRQAEEYKGLGMYKAYKQAYRVYRRNFATEKVQDDILRMLTMVNSFLFALYTQCMFQLETVKLSHPAEYKKIYEEIVNGENYKKMVGNTELATKAETQKLFEEAASDQVDVGVLQDNAVIKLQTDQPTDPLGDTPTVKTGGRSHRKRIRNHHRTYKTHGGYKATIRRSKLSTNRHTPRSRTSHRPNILI